MKKNYFKNLMQVSLLLGAAFVISSCDDVIGQEDNPVASYLQWDASVQKSYTLKIGQTATVKAVAVSSAVIVYESGNEEVAKVNPVSGEITAVGVGKTVIKAVVTGASSAGQSVFQTTSVEVPIEVKDGNAKLTRVKDEVVEYTANVDSVIDLTKLFTAYPEVGTGAQKSTVAYTILGKNDKKTPATQDLATINAAEVKILANGTIRDWYKQYNKKGTDISDTLYVEASLTPNDTKEYKVAKPTDVVDTIMVIINKSIAYMNAEGKREILTADKYKTDIDLTKPIEAGTYYVGSSYWNTSTNVVIKGNVTLISAGNNLGVNTLTDQTDNATLKIFGEAINTATKGEYNTANPYIYVQGDNGDGISNFNQIDFYTGDIYVRTQKANCGAFENVKNINVFGGYLDARNSTSGYAINLKEGGKFTVDGGAAYAAAAGEDTKVSFAIVGDVNVKSLSKTGNFTAESAYRAVKGNVTKGDKIKLYNDEDKEIQDNSGNPKKITTVAPVAP